MRRPTLFIIILFISIVLLFFNPILKGWIPFPGDILVGTPPYNTNSFLGYAPGGVPNKGQGPDIIHQSYPWKYFVADSWKNGQVPFWTPYNFSGTPLMANFQSGTFYLFNLLLIALSFMDGWTIYILLSPLLASFFMYLFLRQLRLTQIASSLGGVVFAFSSYMTVWMEYGNITHTLLWLPLVLYFTEKYLKSTKWQYIVAITGALWMAILAGYIQGFFYLVGVVVVYFLGKSYGTIQKNPLKIVVFLATILFSALLSAFQLLPTLSLFALSSRSDYTLSQITTLLNPWWYSITTFIPDFFGNPASRNSWFDGTYIERVSYFGLIPLLFALAVLFKKKREIIIFSFLFVVSFILALDVFITRYLYLLPIPILSTTVPTRILGIFCSSGAVLAAYGLDYFQQGRLKKRLIITSGIGLVGLLLAWAFVFIGPHVVSTIEATSFSVTKHNLVLPTFFLIVFMGVLFLRFFPFTKRYSFLLTIIPLFLFVVTIGDLFYFFQKITPFSPREFTYPQTDVISYLQTQIGNNRYWGYGSAYISGNFQTYDKTFSTDGLDALHLKTYTELMATAVNGHLPNTVSRDIANIPPGYGPSDLPRDQNRQRILNITGVKYILNKSDSVKEKYEPDLTTFNEKNYKLLWQKAPWQIYQNLQVLPRVFLVDKFEVITDKKTALARLFDQHFNPATTILLEKKPQLSFGPLKQKSAKITDYQPNKVSIVTSSDTNSLLFLSDNYTPDWRVTIDGKNAKVYKADYSFRAVELLQGQHEVVFSYDSPSFSLGWHLSLGGFIFFITGLIILKKKKILL